MSDYAKREKN